MKRVIRRNVWETNSSSSHTVSIRGKSVIDTSYNSCVTNLGIIKVTLGEYGWSGPTCYSFEDKLAYALSMVLHTEYPGFDHWDDNFVIDDEIMSELNGYKMICDAIKHRMGDNFKSIVINRDYGEYPYGYIDHQSCYYNSLQDFLDDWHVDIDKYLFDESVSVYIDNDNH